MIHEVRYRDGGVVRLDAKTIEFMVRFGEPLHYEAEQALTREGDASDSVFLILEGEASVMKEDLVGNTVAIAALEPGALVGEMGILTSRPRSATILARTPLVALRLGKREFLAALAASEEFRFRVFQGLSQSLEDLGDKVSRLYWIQGLFALHLHMLEKKYPEICQESCIEVGIDREEIEQHFGLDQDEQQRLLTRLAQNKLIGFQGASGGKDGQLKVKLDQFQDYLKKHLADHLGD